MSPVFGLVGFLGYVPNWLTLYLIPKIVDLPLFESDELPHCSDGLREIFHKCIEQEPTGHRGRPRKPEKVVNADLD